MSPPAWNAGHQTGTRGAPRRARRNATHPHGACGLEQQVGDGSRFAVGRHPLLRTEVVLIRRERASGNHSCAGGKAHEVDGARDWGSDEDA